ncbi:hypothetical protein AB4Y40_40505 [Paraburkholderia sp. EG287B]|uniref:hypothetical protein n=1 Tax=Paraburkholderia sp. EG287B TaxID=3237010 RepID=UPI0034D1905B
MGPNQSVFIVNGRSSYGVFSFVFVTGVVLAWSASFDGPAVRISSDYWWWVAPAAVLPLVLIVWRLQRALVGTTYKPRGAATEHVMGRGESWATGTIAAAILVFLAMAAFANIMNQVIGVPYVANYDVTAKHVERGKHTCYALTVTKVGDAADQFEMCVAQREHDETALGDLLELHGRRSRFVNQVLGYTRSH